MRGRRKEEGGGAMIGTTNNTPNEAFKLVVQGYYRTRSGSTYVRQAQLVTNIPGAITLGEISTECGGDWRLDERSEETFRQVQIGQQLVDGTDGFVAYATFRESSSGHGGETECLVPLLGEVPVLHYDAAYLGWAEAQEGEAYAFLQKVAEGSTKKVRRSLAFAAGWANAWAPHEQRCLAWRAALIGLGYSGELSRIVGSVRTATVKAALCLGWQPSVQPPKYWRGLPEGVYVIDLEE